MRARVRVELRAQAEGAAADAHVRALARVHGAVRAQLGGALEGGAALRARARARAVRARVHAQRRQRLGRLPAHVAHVRPLLRVRLYVVVQVRPPGERFVTGRARERSLLTVQGPHVPRQIPAVGEGSPARVTAVPFLPVMQSKVSPPRHHRDAFIAEPAPRGSSTVRPDGQDL